MAHIKKPLSSIEPKKPLGNTDQLNSAHTPLKPIQAPNISEVENSKKNILSQDSKEPQKNVTNPDSQKLELYHSVSSALNTAINTIGTEIAKLRVRSVNTQSSLDEKELKALNDFFKTLIAYEAHQAALAKQEALTGKLSDLSDEDLLEMVNKTLKEKK